MHPHDSLVDIQFTLFFAWMAAYVFNEILTAYPNPLQSITAVAGLSSASPPLMYSIIILTITRASEEYCVSSLQTQKSFRELFPLEIVLE